MKTLRDLQVGDEVIVNDPYSREGIAKIAKVTKEYIYTEAPYIKYHIKDGYEVGVGYRWSKNIRVGTTEEIEEVRSEAIKACLSHYFSRFDWSKCDLVFLEGILELMKSSRTERKVGEIFEFDGVRLKVVAANRCYGCYFRNQKGYCKKGYYKKGGNYILIGPCPSSIRKDGTSIIFKEISNGRKNN